MQPSPPQPNGTLSVPQRSKANPPPGIQRWCVPRRTSLEPLPFPTGQPYPRGFDFSYTGSWAKEKERASALSMEIGPRPHPFRFFPPKEPDDDQFKPIFHPDASSSSALPPAPPAAASSSTIPLASMPPNPAPHSPAFTPANLPTPLGVAETEFVAGPNALRIACYNLGGPSITKERYGHTLLALRQLFPTLPKVVALSEFKPTGASLHEFHWMTQVASLGQYHLLPSIDPQGKNGVALLVHQDLCPNGPPQLIVAQEARVIAFSAKLHPDPAIPPVSFVAVYGSSIPHDRPGIQQSLTPFLQGMSIIFGDLNAITRMEDADGISLSYAQRLMWPWLCNLESKGDVVDLMRFTYHDIPPKTRCRGHAGKTRLDHIFVSKALFSLLSPFQPNTSPLLHESHPLSDHDLVALDILPWSDAPMPPRRCQGWGKKQVRKFKTLSASFHPHLEETDMDGMQPSDQVGLALALQEHLLRCMDEVNQAHPPKARPTLPEWAAHVKSLMRLARRNPKLFFRRVRFHGLAPMRSPQPPMNPDFLRALVQEQIPFDSDVVNSFPAPMEAMPDLPPPTDAQLLQHTRVPRGKSPGPDGLPPYLLYLLPPRLFHLVANCIRFSLSLQCPLPLFFDAQLIGLYKPKKDWWSPAAWRPIAMAHAGYRIGMRFIKTQISAQVYSSLSPMQFGGRPGRSPGTATLTLLETLHAHSKSSWAVFLDVRNAFSSVPFALMMALLARLKFPPNFLQLFGHILYKGCFHMVPSNESFYASSGIRQGCPLSAMLFVLFYDLLLRILSKWTPIAFVDDIAAVTTSEIEAKMFIQEAWSALQRMGLNLNVSKTEILPLEPLAPPTLSIPTTAVPPCTWTYQPPPAPGLHAMDVLPSDPPQPLASSTIPTTSTVMHLGHLLSADLSPATMYADIMNAAHDLFTQFHQRPLPLYARLKVLNQVIAPQLLFRLEHLPPVKACLEHLGTLTQKFLLALSDVPSHLVKKTLFTHKKAGLGAFHLPTLIPQRVLDVVHKSICTLSADKFAIPHNGWLVQCVAACTNVLGIPTTPCPRQTLLQSPARASSSTHYLAALDLYCHETPHPLRILGNEAFADGSFFPSTSQCASSVLLPNHKAFVLKPRGRPSCYRAEVYALAMAVDLVQSGAKIYTDSAAALNAIKGFSTRVTLAIPIHHIRTMAIQKNLRLVHVRGHTGIAGNEIADRLAKSACHSLPAPPPQVAANPWDICVDGELQTPPHKTWIRSLAPHHNHADIHPCSWKPLPRPGWLAWLFGAKCAKGFAHPSSYWRNQRSPSPCQFCAGFHNASVHGHIGLCPNTENPLVATWIRSWGPHSALVASWRLQAQARDRFLLGKLVLPNSLVEYLKLALGPRAAKACITSFHTQILRLLPTVLPTWHPEEKHTFKRKLSPYEPAGWDTGPASLPRPHGPSARQRRRTVTTTHSQPPIAQFLLPRRPPSPDHVP